MSRNFASIAHGKGCPDERKFFLVEESPEGGYTAKAFGKVSLPDLSGSQRGYNET